MKPEIGIHFDTSFGDYCAWEAVNNSSLGATERSVRHYRDQQPIGDTAALHFGRLCHTGKLEPAALGERYVVMPEFEKQLRRKDGTPYGNPKATKEYKALCEEFRAANEGREFVTAETLEDMIGVVAAIDANERAREYFAADAKKEASIVWEDADTGLLCKARLDCWDSAARRITDLKTTRDASRFQKAIQDWRYHRQAAFYIDGIRSLLPGDDVQFCIVAVEKEKPYGCRAAPMSEEAVSVGRREYKEALAKIAEAKRTDNWPCYDDPPQWELHPPAPSTLDLQLSLKGELVRL